MDSGQVTPLRHTKRKPSRTRYDKYCPPTAHNSTVATNFFSTSTSGASSPLSYHSQSSEITSSTQSPALSQVAASELASPPHPPVRPQPRIQVSSLLAEPSSRTYKLEIEQQPSRTAEFGTMYLSRVPITPPIIARLIVRDPSGNSIVPDSELPFLVAHLSLYSGDGACLDSGSYIGRGSSANPPILYGHLVATVEQLEDLQGNTGLFFLFPDASIRTKGRYQLEITLTRITSPESTGMLSEHGTLLAQVRTWPFDAISKDEYVAAPPTRLTQSFIRQGARISLTQ